MKVLLAVLGLGLSAWQAHGATGAEGKAIKLHDHGVTASLQVPVGWKVHSAAVEPLDWDYAAEGPHAMLSFGVAMRANLGGLPAEKAYARYLAEVRKLYDPKVTMEKAPALHLADGRVVTPYRFSSAYWKERVVMIVPEGKTALLMEFCAPSPKEMARARPILEGICATYHAAR